MASVAPAEVEDDMVKPPKLGIEPLSPPVWRTFEAEEGVADDEEEKEEEG